MSNTLSTNNELSEATKLHSKPWMYGIIAIVFGVIIGGLLFIARYNANDYARDVQSWREKLNLIAESRKADVTHFVLNNFSELHTLADNPSLKLYLTELQMTPQGADVEKTGEPAQKSYLRNLLLFTAQRAGFMSTTAADAIPANIPTENKGGLVILDKNNQLVVGTPMVTGSMMKILEHAKGQKAGEDELIDLQKDTDGTIYLGFSVPIFSLQGERNAEGQIGKIIAMKVIDKNLFGLLKQPGATEKTLEVLLIRYDQDKGKAEYLSQLQDGSLPFSSEIAQNDMETQFLKGADFVSKFPDHRGQPVLATARKIAGTEWIMIVKIDQAEAFAESGAHRASITMSFTLIIAIIVLLMVTMWWYSYSQHALMSSSYFRKIAAQSQAQEKLLRLVTDYQPEAIYIVDSKQTYHFANQRVATIANMSASSIIGKTVADVRGTIRAEQVAEQCNNALLTGYPIYNVHHEKSGENDVVIRSGYIPLKEIPVATLPPKTTGVLVVEQDVSEVFHERERRLSTQKQLVQTLLGLVDKRDPFAANHSLLVSQLAQQIADDLGLDNISIETTKIAANLMNIGKIAVPTELLTKTGVLTDDEKATIRSSMDAAADLLAQIPFDGPVAETLKEWQERWDGKGPLGLAKDDILISARIIAVANVFIGMISPRSWRNAMTVEAANKFLLDNVGSYFDQRVVIALIHYVDSKNGREWINNILKNQKKIA